MFLNQGTLFANRFRLVELKGRGTFGEVWQARDEQLENMEVAVKIYIALDDRGIADFKKEYKNTFGLSHPNLLHAYHFDLFESTPYLVMPYCPKSATAMIGLCRESTLWRFIRDTASGLAYLHEEGIVHRDIKPDNLLVDKRGNFLISDFGISKKLRTTFQRNSHRDANEMSNAGTIPYMAPELFDLSGTAVFASDIWSLGATLYEMATGELPFFGQGGSMLRFGSKITRPNLPYSQGLVDTILECLEKEPWDRPKAKELAERAQAVIDGHPYESNKYHTDPDPPVIVNTPSEPDYHDPDGIMGPVVKPTTNKRWLWVLLAVVLVGGVLAARGISNTKKLQADNELFYSCKTCDDYSNYLKQYPNGVHYDIAQHIIDSLDRAKRDRDRDSLQNLRNKVREETPDKKKEENKETNKPETKGEKKPETKVEKPRPTEEDWNRTTPKKEPADPNQGLTPDNNLPPSLNPRLEPDTPKDGRNWDPDKGLKENYPVGDGQQEKSKYESVAKGGFQINDCMAYLNNYPLKKDDPRDKKTRWSTIANEFKKWYLNCIESNSNNAEELKRILDNHDSLMKELHFNGNDAFDRKCKIKAQQYYDRLNRPTMEDKPDIQ